MAQDWFHLNIHRRKHSGYRPFQCHKCTFGFYKKSDLTKHLKTCGGIKYQCEKCQTVFHFKKPFEEHSVWSESCGTMRAHIQTENQFEKPSVARIHLGRHQSVVGVNLELDPETFDKRKRRSRCGLCIGCERIADCGKCDVCLGSQNGNKVKCQNKRCIYLIDQFVIKKEKKSEELDQLLNGEVNTD